MASLLLPRHAEAPMPPTTATASARLLGPRGRPRLGFASCGASVAAASPDASGRALCHRHASVAAPSPLASTRRRPDGDDGGGLLVLAFAASAHVVVDAALEEDVHCLWSLTGLGSRIRSKFMRLCITRCPLKITISASFIFFSAIRSMLDCKRAAESLEKSFDSRRERLPETMASVRLVGREISDLSVDLSDLSQDLRKVVRSSMSIVHTADAQLNQLTTSAPEGAAQRVPHRKKVVGEPLLATTVRELRELIADIRSGFGAAFGMASLFMWASNFGSKRPKNR